MREFEKIRLYAILLITLTYGCQQHPANVKKNDSETSGTLDSLWDWNEQRKNRLNDTYSPKDIWYVRNKAVVNVKADFINDEIRTDLQYIAINDPDNRIKEEAHSKLALENVHDYIFIRYNNNHGIDQRYDEVRSVDVTYDTARKLEQALEAITVEPQLSIRNLLFEIIIDSVSHLLEAEVLYEWQISAIKSALESRTEHYEKTIGEEVRSIVDHRPEFKPSHQ